MRRLGCSKSRTCTEKRPPLSMGKTVWPWPRGRLFKYCRVGVHNRKTLDLPILRAAQLPILGRIFTPVPPFLLSAPPRTHHEEGDEPAGAHSFDGARVGVVSSHIVVQVELVEAAVAHHLLQVAHKCSVGIKSIRGHDNRHW